METYTLAEVAGILKLHVRTVQRHIWTGALPASRLGHRTVRVTEDGIREFLANRPAVPPEDNGTGRKRTMANRT